MWVVVEYSFISDEWRFCGSGITYKIKEARLYRDRKDAMSYTLNHRYTIEKDSDYYLVALPAVLAIFLIP